MAAPQVRGHGHVFYDRRNQLLAAYGFHDHGGAVCHGFYAKRMGRPGLETGVYFRMLLIEYFEGLDSERAIAWRCADSLSLPAFLGYAIDQNPPDHSRSRGRVGVSPAAVRRHAGEPRLLAQGKGVTPGGRGGQVPRIGM